ncbi:MAG: sterol desaturase family protein [Sphingomicrobium sp.]
MPLFLALSIAVVSILTILEIRNSQLGAERLLNLQIWALELGAKLAILPLATLATARPLLDARQWPFWLAFPTFLLVMDLAEYLFHRAQHAIPFLWAMHSLHHSDSNMTATTTERHFWGDQLVKALTIWPLAFLIVRPSAAAWIGYGLAGYWNYVAHSSLSITFGRWSWLLNSPAYHRRHHSSLPEHFNSNYAALLPIWDVLLRSYNRPVGFPPTGFEHRPNNALEALLWPIRRAAV